MNKNLLEVGNMYVVVRKLYCLRKSDIDINDVESLFVWIKTHEISENNLIMYLGSQRADKGNRKYSIILKSDSVYYTYNPKKLLSYVCPYKKLLDSM